MSPASLPPDCREDADRLNAARSGPAVSLAKLTTGLYGCRRW